jgi:hypothetical protein
MMANMLVTGLALGAAGAALGMTVDHHTQLDHHSGRVAVRYRGNIAIQHKQVGTATGGRSSTPRCDWSAKMTVAILGATSCRQAPSADLPMVAILAIG